MVRITLRDRLELTLLRTRVSVGDLVRFTSIRAEVFDRVFRGVGASFTSAQLVAVAAALRCEPAWLLGLTDTRPDFRAARRAVAASLATSTPSRRGRAVPRIRSVPLSSFGRRSSAATRHEAVRGQLAARLAAFLEEAGTSRGALARAAGIPRHRLDDLAAGRQRDLNVEELAAVVRASGRTAAWWLGTTTLPSDAP